jgi:DNA-binding protein HU-beta
MDRPPAFVLSEHGYETEMCITSFSWPDRSHVRQKNLAQTTIVVMPFISYCQRVESMNNVTATITMKASSQKSDGAPPIVTLKAIFEQLAETHALPKKQVGEMLADFVTAVTAHLQTGSRIRMSGLGTLEVKKREARVGRNPATGETIQIMASKKVTFRPAKELKEAM